MGVCIKRGILGESKKQGKSHFWDYGDRWQQDGHFSGPPKKRPLFPGPKNRVFRAVFSAPKIGLFLVVLKFGPYFRGPEIRASFLVVLKNDHPAASDRHNPRNVILPVFRIPLKFPFLCRPLKPAI